jgi:hypothetical protein
MATVKEQIHTVEEFEAFIQRPENADRLFELIDGEIVEKVPTEEHGVLALLLGGEIYIYLKCRLTKRMHGFQISHLPAMNERFRLQRRGQCHKCLTCVLRSNHPMTHP